MTDHSSAPPRMRLGTFLGVPPATTASAGQIAIMGLPFDCGTHATRIGSRQGPASFRAMSSEVRPYYPPLADVDPRADNRVVDLGDVEVVEHGSRTDLGDGDGAHGGGGVRADAGQVAQRGLVAGHDAPVALGEQPGLLRAERSGPAGLAIEAVAGR